MLVFLECLITGDETSCNCSVGYIWSNDVCYSSSDTCCREETCKKNVSHIVPLCIPKVIGNSPDFVNYYDIMEKVSPLI